MQMVRIQFPDEKGRTQGFYELIQRVRIVCLPDDEFVIPEAGLAILDERGIAYTIFCAGSLIHPWLSICDQSPGGTLSCS